MTSDKDPLQPLVVAPIARVHSPYREKFGVPRQPGLVSAASGYLEMLPGYDLPEAFDGLQGFSHLWVIFGFHQCAGQWKARVRPPRLGGNREVGVFASRAPFRPNNLGLSVLRFEGLETETGVRLAVSGLDLVDGTPVYDIKPYVPYSDSLPQARGGFADSSPELRLQVEFDPAALQVLRTQPDAGHLRELIEQTLALDPRPAYRQGDSGERVYGMQLQDLDVRWRVEDGRVRVVQIVPTR